MSDNPMKDYVDNFRANLPSGVTYDSDITRYFANGKRFLNEWEGQRYIDYIQKFGFSVSPIEAIVFPSFGTLTDGDTLEDELSAGIADLSNYQSTAGNIVSVEVRAFKDGVDQGVIASASGSFDPADLFTGGRLGAIYDPGDAPSVSVTDGRLTSISDRSQNANLPLAQTTASAQPLFGADANGDYWEQTQDVTWLEADTRLGLDANPDLEIWAAIEILNDGSLNSDDNGVFLIGSAANDTNSIMASVEANNVGGFRFFGGNTLFPRALSSGVFTWSRDAGSTYGDSQFAENGQDKAISSAGNPGGSPSNTLEKIITRNTFDFDGGNAEIRYRALIVLGFRTTTTERAKLLTWMGNKLGQSL